MTSTRNPKTEQRRHLENSLWNYWLQQSVTTHNQAGKNIWMNKSNFKLVISEIGLHGYKNESENDTDEKNLFKKFNVKVIKTISYKMKSLTRFS